MILKRVLDFGLSKRYFEKLEIQNIDKSCCQLEYQIIDFDRTKDIICKEANQTTRKSCDGLCLKKSIDFIEFKSINNFFDKEFKYKLKANKKNLDESEIIKEKVSKFNFKKKIRDSLWLWDYILNHHELKLNNSDLESIYAKSRNYFIVKDEYQPLINIVEQFNMLAQNSNNQLSNRKTMDILIEKELSKISLEINKPKLIDCNELKIFLEAKEKN